MSDTPDHHQKIDEILDIYAVWFLKIARCVFYPAQDETMQEFSRPGVLSHWLDSTDVLTAGQKSNIEHLSYLFRQKAEELVTQAKQSEQAPSLDEYDSLTRHYIELITALKALTKEGAQTNETAKLFKPFSSFAKDMKSELDRLDRQGVPFSVAFLRVDEFELVETPFEQYVEAFSNVITASLRSFDEVYCPEEGVFVLSLKQSDRFATLAVLERLYSLLAHAQISVSKNGQSDVLSVSACIAEPVPSTECMALLENMKRDLENRKGDEKSIVLEYEEITALERLAQEAE